MRHYRLNPVDTLEEMRRRLEIQDGEEGTLLAYLDKMHYPLWITQFYENIVEGHRGDRATRRRPRGVETLELRYSPVIHTYAGLTPRQSIRAVLSGMNHAQQRAPDMKLGLIVIAMRQHGPHIAKILARQAIAEAQHLHERTGVVGFDIAGPERGNPPRLFKSAYEIARLGRLGLTAHAGEDAPPEYVWQAIDELGRHRIGHGCSAVRDPELLKRLARTGSWSSAACRQLPHRRGAARRRATRSSPSSRRACRSRSAATTPPSRAPTRCASRVLAAAQVGVAAVEAIHGRPTPTPSSARSRRRQVVRSRTFVLTRERTGRNSSTRLPAASGHKSLWHRRCPPRASALLPPGGVARTRPTAAGWRRGGVGGSPVPTRELPGLAGR